MASFDDFWVLVVAGGGAGGNMAYAGGGGAGGYQENQSFSLDGGSYAITVGLGGTGNGGNGGNSSIGSELVSVGGGGGGGAVNTPGSAGGSGGGGAYASGNGGSGTPGQGNAGGKANAGAAGGGGGGASMAGGNATAVVGGPGGAGSASSITGSSVTRAGGGGGNAATNGAGGAGGGGNGRNNGTANTGGGGGGFGGNGGSGVVIIRFPTDGITVLNSSGANITTSGGDTILTYTGNGTFEFIPGLAITTEAPTDIADKSATLNGAITDINADATRRGFVLDDSPISDPGDVDPSTLGITVIDESGTFGVETFDLPATGLSPETQYYVRAFAEDPDGFYYGDQVDFTTLMAARFVMSPTANITDGEPTTAQLSAPSGKNTGDFSAGTMQDDNNPTDPIDIGDDEYTEIEFAIEATEDAELEETYEFRIVAGGEPLDTYSVTPEWTITEGVSGNPGAFLYFFP